MRLRVGLIVFVGLWFAFALFCGIFTARAGSIQSASNGFWSGFFGALIVSPLLPVLLGIGLFLSGLLTIWLGVWRCFSGAYCYLSRGAIGRFSYYPWHLQPLFSWEEQPDRLTVRLRGRRKCAAARHTSFVRGGRSRLGESDVRRWLPDCKHRRGTGQPTHRVPGPPHSIQDHALRTTRS